MRQSHWECFWILLIVVVDDPQYHRVNDVCRDHYIVIFCSEIFLFEKKSVSLH